MVRDSIAARLGPPLIRVAVTVIAVWWVVGQVDVSRLGTTLSGLHWSVLCIPVAGVALNTLIHAHRLRLLCAALGVQLGLFRVAAIVCRGAFAGLALPQGGSEVVKAVLLGRAGGGMNLSVSALVAAKATQFPIMVLLLIWALVSGVLVGSTVLVAGAASYSVVALIVLWVAVRGLGVPRWTPGVVRRRLKALQEAMGLLRSNQAVIVRCVLWSVPAVVLNCAVVWGLLEWFGHPHGFGTVLALVPAMDVVIWMPISLAGIGVRESVFAIALVPRGLAMDTAIAIGMIRWTGELARAAIGCMLWLLSAAGPGRMKPEISAGGSEND